MVVEILNLISTSFMKYKRIGFEKLTLKERDFIIKKAKKLENVLQDVGVDKKIKVNNNMFSLKRLVKFNKLFNKVC